MVLKSMKLMTVFRKLRMIYKRKTRIDEFTNVKFQTFRVLIIKMHVDTKRCYSFVKLAEILVDLRISLHFRIANLAT